MKIALICDMHMPENKNSIQWNFFRKSVEKIKKDGIDTVVCLGDITAFGEYNAFEEYLKKMENFNHYYVLGNSDVRDKNTQPLFEKKSKGFEFKCADTNIKGISTPYAKIDKDDMDEICAMSDGDVLFLHHSIPALCEESRNFIEKTAEEKALTIIHAHSHKWLDYNIGKSRVICLRAIDPDKSIGDYPCITYFDTQTKEFTETVFENLDDSALDARRYFGISCVDNFADVNYALENNVYGVELRCNGRGWEPDLSLIPLIEKWRKKTNGYLSVHMPNLKWKDGAMEGVEQWYKAIEYAKAVNTDGMTIHPPRVKSNEFEAAHDEFLKLYKYAVESMDERVNIGIENLHMASGETNNEERCFGYIPKEVSLWIDEINQAIGKENRVRHTLDVGHARNNGVFAQIYPISRWYEIMGNRTVAYHIHQVIRGENGLKNHTAIEGWFGPMISYASYFYAWKHNLINHVPIFLEVKGWENYEKSIQAFEKTFNK